MRAVVQRVSSAAVRVNDQVVGETGFGLCVLLGVAREDESADAERLAERVARLRIFENAGRDGRLDASFGEDGRILVPRV